MNSMNNSAKELDAASVLMDNGDMQGAMAAYRRITDQDPGCDEAWLMLGSLYGEAGDLSQASECVEKAIELNPEAAAAYLVLGHIRRAAGETNGALDCFRKAVQYDPEDAETHCVLGGMLQETGELGSAIESFEKAVSLDGSLADVWKTLGYLQLKTGNAGQAVKSFSEARKTQPVDLTVLHGLTKALISEEKYQEAEAVARSGLDSHQDRIEVHALLAETQSAQGAHGNALETVENLVTRFPFSGECLVLKADFLERAGHYEQAFDIIKPYLEDSTPNPGAALVLSRFSHKVGLGNECELLLQKLLGTGNLSGDLREQLTMALEAVKKSA